MAKTEQDLLSTEILNRGIESLGPNASSMTFSIRVRRRLPDFFNSVNLKYVKLGYHYLINHAIYLATIPVLVLVFSAEVESLSREEIWKKIWEDASNYDVFSLLGFFGVFVFTLSVYFMSRLRSVYLIDFACYKPHDDLKVSNAQFIEQARKSGKFDKASIEFQKRILASSGIGDETYIPKFIMLNENCSTMKEGRLEASTVTFGALHELFEKTKIRPKDIGVLVVNCSIFNPTPSLSAMIINHYKMRGNILSYNLGGMGCSAEIIGVNLARYMLQGNPNNYAIVVSTEMVGFNWYAGRDRSMLVPNCFFRMGCSAVMLSNRRRDYPCAKYRLEHIVRTHKGADDRSFRERSVCQEEDEKKLKGEQRFNGDISGDAHKTNITTLGPLVLPFSEQFFFFETLLYRYFFKGNKSPVAFTKPYIPNYKLAFEYFYVHAASKTILDELQRNLELNDKNVEASRMTLHRFGNTSSSSIWFELAYLEAKESVKRGDRVWQIAFGSGFKCNSIVWKAMCRVKKPVRNPWLD